jgi:hypothetical protein
MNNSFRPTFYFEDDKTKPIRAGGVLIYKFVDDQIKLLMIKTNYNDEIRFEDIGGKTDINDVTEFDTVSREVSEETNLIINQQIIKYQLKNSTSIYIPNSKYILYLVEANLYERNLKSNYFGNKEIYDDIKRTIHWINLETYLNNKVKIHPRICSNDVKEIIYDYFKAS